MARCNWRALGVLLAVGLAVVATGCRREQIRVYRAPKDHHHANDGHNHDHDQARGAAAMPKLTWQTPAGWTEQPPSEFRVASFKVAGPEDKLADVSVIPLPGGAGGELSNVNRWRGQVGLEPITEEELKKIAEPVAMEGPACALYDLPGPTIRILAAMQVRDGVTWFYKMTGDTALVGEQKEAFRQFLKSLAFKSAPAAAPAAARLSGPVPADWQPAEPGQFLVAKYQIDGGANGQATVNVSSADGDGGGLTANVNRWRQQLGLNEISGDELTAATKLLPTKVGRGMLVQMAGAQSALVAVVVPHGSQTWFFKLMGDPRVVSRQQEAFTKYVQEASF